MADQPLALSDVLRDEYLRLHGELPADIETQLENTTDEPRRIRLMYQAIHLLAKTSEKGRSALCISGGGIRSATFALGVLQRMADLRLLAKFHFLSTISGGGYIGGWLSSLVRRTPGGMRELERKLSRSPDGNPIAPEIEPVTWLRRFSNYLTPKLGLLSGDTWAFAGSYLRNLILGWLIYVPFLAAIVAVPRLAVAVLRSDVAIVRPDVLASIAGILILIATAILAQTRPVSYRRPGWLTNRRFATWVLAPYVVAATLLVIYWARVHNGGRTRIDWTLAVLVLILINTVPTIWYMLRFFYALRHQSQGNVRRDSSEHRYAWKKFLAEVLAGIAAGATAGGLLYAVGRLFTNPLGKVQLPTLAAWQTLPPSLTSAPSEVFLCFAVPLVMAVLFLQAAIFVGISSWYNEEHDREWWGRAAGWVLLAGLGWILITGITVYGPVAIYNAPKIYTALGTVSGLVAILLGKSGSTPANAKEKSETNTAVETGSGFAMGLAAPVFAVSILALLSLCTSEILFEIRPPCPPPEECRGQSINGSELATRAAGNYTIRERVDITTRKDRDAGKTTSREFETSSWPAADKAAIRSIEHLWIVDTTRLPEALLLVFGLGGFAWLASFFIGANQFSMHGLYRNRLIRAYLGASRRESERRPNLFTGFDPTDNFGMDRMRAEAFWSSTIRDVAKDGPMIVADSTLAIEDRTKDMVNEAAARPGDAVTVARAADLLARDLNRTIEARQLAKPGRMPRAIVNRREIERRYPNAFHPMDNHRHPMHLIGMTLNLVSGDNLAWQERKAESFSVTPLHAGTFHLGYRPTARYGGPSGVTLGTAVAVSGAAANPNMGYSSSPALAFLLTLFDVRLGWWWGNPKKDTFDLRNPTNTLMTVMSEMFGNTNEDSDFVNLSDGGHFENLGLYEMVLRRCHCVVVSDGSQDPGFGFEDLGNAIRKIRIDLGVDIRLREMQLFPRSRKDPSVPKYCAIGEIDYRTVDGPDAVNGTLLYIKPAFYGEKEPKDVFNYATTYPLFPHQSTGDQWYSESQFESYRQLGYFATNEVANGKTEFETVCDLIEEAKRYVRPETPSGEGRESRPSVTP